MELVALPVPSGRFVRKSERRPCSRPPPAWAAGIRPSPDHRRSRPDQRGWRTCARLVAPPNHLLQESRSVRDIRFHFRCRALSLLDCIRRQSTAPVSLRCLPGNSKAGVSTRRAPQATVVVAVGWLSQPEDQGGSGGQSRLLAPGDRSWRRCSATAANVRTRCRAPASRSSTAPAERALDAATSRAAIRSKPIAPAQQRERAVELGQSRKRRCG